MTGINRKRNNGSYQLQERWKVTGNGMKTCRMTYDQTVLHGEKAHDSWPTVLAGEDGEVCQSPGQEFTQLNPGPTEGNPLHHASLVYPLNWGWGWCIHSSEFLSSYRRNKSQMIHERSWGDHMTILEQNFLGRRLQEPSSINPRNSSFFRDTHQR